MKKLIQHQDSQPYAPEVLLGNSPVVKRLRLQITRVAPHFRVALLIGEQGSGKQTVAREMHRLSPAGANPFVAMSAAEFVQNLPICSGTLYLTGLDSLSPASQPKLLRSLKVLDRETRVVIASRSDLKGMVSAGRMHQDLYDYVGTLEVRVSPLRERLEDFDLLAETMLHRITSHAIFAACALLEMRSYGWPGNLEELWTLCNQLAPIGFIEAHNLPALATAMPSAAPTRLEDVMHRHVMDVLQNCSGNKLRAAELLGISRSTLYRMIESQNAGSRRSDSSAV